MPGRAFLHHSVNLHMSSSCGCCPLTPRYVPLTNTYSANCIEMSLSNIINLPNIYYDIRLHIIYINTFLVLEWHSFTPLSQLIDRRVISIRRLKNQAALTIAERLGFEKVFDLARMHLNGDANEYKESVFAFTSVFVCGFKQIRIQRICALCPVKLNPQTLNIISFLIIRFLMA